MGRALLGRNRSLHLLIVALAMLGMEIDVFSNPFVPELVFFEISAWLYPEDDHTIEPWADDVLNPSRGASASSLIDGPASPSEGPASELVDQLAIDETIALRSEKYILKHTQTSANDLWLLPLRPAPSGLDLVRHSHPAPQRLVPPLLCRFLC